MFFRDKEQKTDRNILKTKATNVVSVWLQKDLHRIKDPSVFKGNAE